MEALAPRIDEPISVRSIHRKAMECCDNADRAARAFTSGNREEWRRAAEYEHKALDEFDAVVPVALDAGGLVVPEMTRSVLARSAANLYLRADMPTEALELANRGIAARPDAAIRTELFDVFHRATAALAKEKGDQ